MAVRPRVRLLQRVALRSQELQKQPGHENKKSGIFFLCNGVVAAKKRFRRSAVLASVGCIVVVLLTALIWQGHFRLLPDVFTISSEWTIMMYNDTSFNANVVALVPAASSIKLEDDATSHQRNIDMLIKEKKENVTVHQNGNDSAVLHEEEKNHGNTTTQHVAEVLPRPHPHAGAKDEHGQWGYIHDPTYIKKHPLPFIHDMGDGHPICETPFGEGEETATGYEGLKLVTVANDTTSENNHTLWPRILCIIYTHSNRHDTLVKTVVETYAPHCDGFMAASNQTNRTVGAVHIPHEGEESYQEMWNKVRSIWSYVHDNYSNDFDYFHIGGDDLYVIPQNLRQFVATISNASSPFQYLGGLMSGNSWKTYCGGGSGYTLNRATLKVLVEWLLPRCRVGLRSSKEDIMVANCFLRYKRECHCNDTRDDRMATRYHQMGAEWQMEWEGDGRNVMGSLRLKERYNFTYLPGAFGISRSSISFHVKRSTILQTQRIMKRYHAILFPSICQSRRPSP